jgi:ABC-type transporter Mla MlaB component
MGLEVAHYTEENRLDLTVEDVLDLTLMEQVLDAWHVIDDRLETCVIDCTRVSRVFDSGLALMLMLLEKLKQYGVRLIMLGEVPGLHIDNLQISDKLLMSRCVRAWKT